MGEGRTSRGHRREVETKCYFVQQNGGQQGCRWRTRAAASAPLPGSPRARPQRSGSRGTPRPPGSAGPGLSSSAPARAAPAAASGAAWRRQGGGSGSSARPATPPGGALRRLGPGPNPDRTLRLRPSRYSKETCVMPSSVQGPHLCRMTKPGLPEHRHSPLRAALSVRI